MSRPRITIVDRNDEIIGCKAYGTLEKSDIYRVSALWAMNSRDEILFAQRKWTKKHDPGKWGPAVAGTVEEGETYEANIYKETDEEIGVTGVSLQVGPKEFVDGEYKFFYNCIAPS